jgi:response regulator RpfG family c-di-GMP phosphodiesterase
MSKHSAAFRAQAPAAAGLITLAGVLLMAERRSRKAAERLAAATLETLLNAIEANDEQTGMHVRRVAAYSAVLTDTLGLSESDQRVVERVALFHDIGKVHEALFDIIHEHARLTPKERRAIATHPRRGADVLAPLAGIFPELPEAVLSHHERWDGSGYPRGLRGTQIPFAARIVALADTFDAVAHSRRYRAGAGFNMAAQVIAAGRGTQFDPELVDLMLLPPVLARMVRTKVPVAHESSASSRRPRSRHAERRDGDVASAAPDVRFRWRSESLHARGRPPRRDKVKASRPVADGARHADQGA